MTLRQSQRFGKILTHFIQRGNELPELPKGEVFILPFFMSDGFFVRRKIPELFQLADGQKSEMDRHLVQCDAIGVDPELADIVSLCVEEKAHEILENVSDISVLLVAHGSLKNAASREAALFQRDRLRAKMKFAQVELALLEEPPYIMQMLQELDAEKGRPIIMVGLFSANGPHAAEDVPEALAAHLHARDARSTAAIHYVGAVGARPEIVKLIQNSITRRAAEIG